MGSFLKYQFLMLCLLSTSYSPPIVPSHCTGSSPLKVKVSSICLWRSQNLRSPGRSLTSSISTESCSCVLAYYFTHFLRALDISRRKDFSNFSPVTSTFPNYLEHLLATPRSVATGILRIALSILLDLSCFLQTRASLVRISTQFHAPYSLRPWAPRQLVLPWPHGGPQSYSLFERFLQIPTGPHSLQSCHPSSASKF